MNYGKNNNSCDIVNDLIRFECERERRKKEKHARFLIIFIIIYIITIIVGSVMFMYIFDIDLIHAFYASSLIMTGIDIEVVVTTNGQKIFLVFYSFFVILLLLSMASLSVQYLSDIIDY